MNCGLPRWLSGKPRTVLREDIPFLLRFRPLRVVPLAKRFDMVDVGEMSGRKNVVSHQTKSSDPLAVTRTGEINVGERRPPHAISISDKNNIKYHTENRNRWSSCVRHAYKIRLRVKAVRVKQCTH